MQERESAEWNTILFLGLLVLVLVLLLIKQPVFFTDLVLPFFSYLGLHNAWGPAVRFVSEFWQEMGLLLVMLVVVYFGLVLFSREEKKENPEEKPRK